MHWTVLLAAGVVATWPAAGSGQPMNAEVFYQKALALEKVGPMALFSGDVKLLRNEGKAAGERARAHCVTAQREGRQVRYCPLPDKQSLGSTEFMKRLGALPQTDRARIDMTEAMTRILGIKFPCLKS